MNLRIKGALAVASVLMIAAAAKPAMAAILLSDNFDGYADQAAFLAAWPVVAAPGVSGTLTTALSVTAPNSVAFSTAAQRNERTFLAASGTAESGNPSPTNVISFSFDFYDSNAAASPYRQYTDIQDSTSASGTGQLVAIGLNNNLTSSADGGNFYMARILGWQAGAFFKLNDDPTLLRSTGWHNLKVLISDVDFQFYVDGQLAETVLQSALTGPLLRSYDLVRLGSGLTSGNTANFDNVLVQTLVPEPASLLGLGLGAFLLASRRTRRR